MPSRILVIDANRKGAGPPDPFQTGIASMANPKWRVVWSIAQTLKADLVWQSGDTKTEPRGGYDVVVFNRALPAIGANLAWIQANPGARIIHITNDYLVLGGPLYAACLAAKRPCEVIANYHRDLVPSLHRLVADWHEVNLNALLYEPDRKRPSDVPRGEGCVYYGACRPERREMFQKYLTGHVTVSQYPEVRAEFAAMGIPGPWANRVDWTAAGLYPWHASLYLWNTQTNGHYRFLTNRFYEALSYDVYPVFVEEFKGIYERSPYDVPPELIVGHADEIPAACAYEDEGMLARWRERAWYERDAVLESIRHIVRGN